jgi:hypothetical protein
MNIGENSIPEGRCKPFQTLCTSVHHHFTRSETRSIESNLITTCGMFLLDGQRQNKDIVRLSGTTHPFRPVVICL